MDELELFTKAPIKKAYFSLTLPLMLGMIITMIYNLADTYFIGQTGDTRQVAAVSICAPIFTFLIAVGDIFGIGGSSAISRAFGAKEDERAKRICSFCIYFSAACGIIIGLALYFGAPIILRVLGTSKETYAYAEQYLRYIAIGAPFVIVAFSPMNILRTEGFAKASMVGTVLGSIVNIILDPIFILALGMGVKGAAIATTIGNIVTVVFYMLFIMKRSKKFSLDIKWFSIKDRMMEDVLIIGIPASLSNLMQSVATIITNRQLREYGDVAIAAMGVALKSNMIVLLLLVAFAFGVQPLIGYNYGAKNYKRLKEALRFSLIFEISIGCILSILVALGARPLVGFFIDDAELIQNGTYMLRIMMLSGPLVAVILVGTTVFQAMGKAGNALILSISRQGIVFIPVIYIMKACLGYSGVIWAQPIADFIVFVIAGILLRKAYATFDGEEA